jgi:hypothetical protein
MENKERNQEHGHNFFDKWGFFTKNSSWQGKESIPHTTVTFTAIP